MKNKEDFWKLFPTSALLVSEMTSGMLQFQTSKKFYKLLSLFKKNFFPCFGKNSPIFVFIKNLIAKCSAFMFFSTMFGFKVWIVGSTSPGKTQYVNGFINRVPWKYVLPLGQPHKITISHNIRSPLELMWVYQHLTDIKIKYGIGSPMNELASEL